MQILSCIERLGSQGADCEGAQADDEADAMVQTEQGPEDDVSELELKD